MNESTFALDRGDSTAGEELWMNRVSALKWKGWELRTAARPRSATFIHFCRLFSPPNLSSRTHSFSLSFSRSLWDRPSPILDSFFAYDLKRVRKVYTSMYHWDQQVTSSDSYIYPRAFVLRHLWHGRQPLIKFITRSPRHRISSRDAGPVLQQSDHRLCFRKRRLFSRAVVNICYSWEQ